MLLLWMPCCPVSVKNGLTGNWREEYAAQIRVNERRVAQTEGFKAKLYENLVSGILTKEEFLSYKRKYNADIELFQKAIAEWNDKLTDVLENRSERNRWINHFMKFSTMEDIDRRAVMQLIRSIRVMGKDELHIEFNYQDEYQKAISLAEQIATKMKKGWWAKWQEKAENRRRHLCRHHLCMYMWLCISVFLWRITKKRGCSVENQKLVLNDFLSDKPDFVVYDTYIDNGATGTNFHRPGFQQMLSDIEAGHINCVIVKDLSRLGRNSIDTGYYIEQYFHAHNVRFIAVTDQFDTADSGNLHGGIMLPLKNMINEAYALDIGRKIKAQARQAMKDGDYIGARAPYGYRKDPDNCHKLLIDENTAPVVKQIFEWAHEHVSLNRIVRNLNEMGIPAPSHYKKTTGEITSRD